LKITSNLNRNHKRRTKVEEELVLPITTKILDILQLLLNILQLLLNILLLQAATLV
jgi:hypothetical protein